jgi:outer membrane protein assembly factor BamB
MNNLSQGSLIIITSEDERVQAVRLDDRRFTKDWECGTNGVPSPPTVCDDSIYVGDSEGYLYAFDLSGGKKWEYETRYGIRTPPIVSGETVCTRDVGRNVYAVDAETGIFRWSINTHSLSCPLAATDGAVYLGTVHRGVYALDLSTGDQQWHYHPDDACVEALTAGNGAVYAVTDRHEAYMKSSPQGWCCDLPIDECSSVALSDNVVYVGGEGGVCALCASSGEILATNSDYDASGGLQVAQMQVHIQGGGRIHTLTAALDECVWGAECSGPFSVVDTYTLVANNGTIQTWTQRGKKVWVVANGSLSKYNAQASVNGLSE